MTDTTDPAGGPAATTQPGDTWRAGVLLFGGFEPLDAIGPAEVLWSLPHAAHAARAADGPVLPEIRVDLVAESTDPVTAAHGMVVHPTVSYDDCPPLDLLVVPGGGREGPVRDHWGVRYYQEHGPTLDLVRRQAASAGILASVCTGSFILAGAGALAGRRATTHWYSRQALVETMAERAEPFELVEARVVDDGDVVTAGGVSSGIELALHLITRLFGTEAGQVTGLLIEHETPTSSATTAA
jgi:cyclohexyl-isocyanide hydratase